MRMTPAIAKDLIRFLEKHPCDLTCQSFAPYIVNPVSAGQWTLGVDGDYLTLDGVFGVVTARFPLPDMEIEIEGDWFRLTRHMVTTAFTSDFVMLFFPANNSWRFRRALKRLAKVQAMAQAVAR